jgi:hypothetical protein
MNDRAESNLKASLLTQYSVTKSRAAKEEALAMLSFERTKLERTNKRYKRTYYILVGFCFLWTLYNVAMMGLWIKMKGIFGSGDKDSACADSSAVINLLIIIHAVGILDIFMCGLAGRKETHNWFLLFIGCIMGQLIGRIFVYGQYFELPEDSICPFLSHDLAKPSTMKAWLTVELMGEGLILILALRCIWLMYKVRGIKKLFNIMGKTENIWTV